jgi:hypothetical protein
MMFMVVGLSLTAVAQGDKQDKPKPPVIKPGDKPPRPNPPKDDKPKKPNMSFFVMVKTEEVTTAD